MTGVEAWQRVAPDAGGGGTVAALALDERGRGMFAATSVGVFRSWDGGRSWRPPGSRRSSADCDTGSKAACRPNFSPALAEGLAFSPDVLRDRTVYTCTVDGLYRSTDAGDRWQPVLVGSRILSVACLDRDVVLAGTEADGVLRSADAGRTWQSASAGLLDLGVICLASRGGLAFAGTQAGLHRSRSSGQAWRAVGPETPVQCVATSVDGGLVLVGTERDGLFRSTDGGTTWQAVGLDDSQSVSALAISSDHVVVATPLSIAASHDAGVTWRTRPSPGLILALAITGEGLVAGLHQDGLVRSLDDGASWSPPDAGVNARLVSAAAFARDGTLYVADIDAGLRVSPDGGMSWRPCRAGVESPSAMAISAEHVLFASSSAGISYGRPGAESWSLLVPSSMFEAADITAIAPASDGALFVATRTEAEASVWRSTGDAWQRCLVVPGTHPPRLAASADGMIVAAAGDHVFDLTEYPSEFLCSGGIVTALAVKDHTIYVGTTDGVYLSQDGAHTFVNWSEGLPVACRIVALGAVDDAVCAISFGGEVWRRAYPARVD